ncbi:MAG: glycosyl hydrolase family 28-related protein [Planctomycetota bacterium]
MKHPFRVFIVCAVWLVGCIVLVGGRSAPAADTETSPLWGRAGEQWKPGGRLPDFSYAGYHRGEKDLPTLRPDVTVKDFGASGDGETDDTAAFKRALKDAAGKTIFVPRGRYVITDILEIRSAGTVLQGAGPEKSVLHVPKPLEKIRSNMGATTGGRPTSNYSWSGGIVWAKGRWDKQTLSKVTAPAARGKRTLVVERTDKFERGDEVCLRLRDDEARTLTRHLYAGDPGNIDNLRPVSETWIARVTRVQPDSKQLVFDRPLRTDVRLEWNPVLTPASSSVEEVGIEHLSFEFPVTPYKGHFTELGYNAIAYGGVRNCWVRDIVIRHADSGLFLRGGNTTVTDVVWGSDRDRDSGRNATGHHGITLGGTDSLLANFDFQTKFIHDITMTRGSAGNVTVDGRGEDLTFDHHKYANHANLFSDIDAGVGTNIFRSGGGAKLGRHCGGWTTWWNIRTERPVRFPAGWAADLINIVGVKSDQEPMTDPEGRWFEPTPPKRLRPENLYESQLKRRLEPEN